MCTSRYACVCTCTHVTMCTHMCAFVCHQVSMWTHACVLIPVHVCAHVHLCAQLWSHASMHVCMHVHTCVYICICVCAHACIQWTCTSVCVSLCVCVLVCVYAHTCEFFVYSLSQSRGPWRFEVAGEVDAKTGLVKAAGLGLGLPSTHPVCSDRGSFGSLHSAKSRSAG